jgi:hypothetical protein
MVVHACNTNYVGGGDEDCGFQASWGKKSQQEPIAVKSWTQD